MDIRDEMSTIRDLFVTRVYEGSLAEERGFAAFNAELEDACRMLAAEDRAGRAWCRANGYGGYTPTLHWTTFPVAPACSAISSDGWTGAPSHLPGASISTWARGAGWPLTACGSMSCGPAPPTPATSIRTASSRDGLCEAARRRGDAC